MSTIDRVLNTQTLEPGSRYAIRYVNAILPIVKEDPRMIVVMRADATKQDIDTVLSRLAEHQLKGHLSRGEERTIIGVVGAGIPPTLREELELLDGVQEAVRITRPYKLAAREFHPENTIVDVRGIKVG